MKNQQLEKTIFEALGAASMCWSETPAGVFDSTKANEIGKKLLEDIHSSYDPLSIVINAIRTGPDVYYLWQTQIARAVQEEFVRAMDGKKPEELTEINISLIANNAARNFLNTLCNAKYQEESQKREVPQDTVGKDPGSN